MNYYLNAAAKMEILGVALARQLALGKRWLALSEELRNLRPPIMPRRLKPRLRSRRPDKTHKTLLNRKSKRATV